VPITGPNAQIIGTICVFDLKPLALSDGDVDALKALGRSVTFGEQLSQEVDPPAAHAGQSAPQQPAAVPKREAPAAPVSESAAPLLDRLNGEFAAARELARARREQRQVSVVLFSVGDAVQNAAASSPDAAEMVGRSLLKTIRESDLPIRWSGDEVILMLPGLALDDARRVAERVRAALQAGTGHRAAVSAGVAELLPSETFGALVSRARDRVQLALEHGHNRVA
jgi:diguanylate cyclase (GGDEF)-like protein